MEVREPVSDAGRPVVTIVTAAYQAAGTIGLTLDSVAAQSCRDLEHLVVDGGSSDGTCGRVRAAPHRPRLVSGPDHGIYDAYNRGLALARGEWVTFLNADDAYAHPGVLETVARAARALPDVDVLHGDVDLVDRQGRVARRLRFQPRHDPDDPRAPENYAGFVVRQEVFTPATFFRRELLLRLGGFDATYAIAGDYDLLLRAWRAGARFRPISDVLVRMRDDGVSERRHALRAVESFRAAHRRTGEVLRPGLELLRYESVTLLERHAPAVTDAVRALKRRLLPAPHGAFSAAARGDSP